MATGTASTPAVAEGATRPLALDIDASPIAAAAGAASSKTPVRRGWLYEPKPTDSWCTYLTRPWVLLVVSTYTDLFTLRWWQALFLLVLMGISLLFSFLDINYLVRGPSDYTPTQNRWENTAALGLEYYKRVLFMLSGVASFTGAVSVVMAAKSRFSTYSWGFINIWAFGSFAWANGYAGDAQMNIIFFTILQIWGVYQWCNHMDAKQAAEVRNLKWWGWIITVAGAVGLAAAFYWEIPKFFDAIVGDGTYFYPGVTTPHILDAVASTFNLIGMILMVLRCWEQWIFWVALDCIQLAMFTGTNGYPTDFNVTLNYAFFLANALYGLVYWFRKWQRQAYGRAWPSCGQAPAAVKTVEETPASADGGSPVVDAAVVDAGVAVVAAVADAANVAPEAVVVEASPTGGDDASLLASGSPVADNAPAPVPVVEAPAVLSVQEWEAMTTTEV